MVMFGKIVFGGSVGVAGCKKCLELVGNFGFASHDAKADALDKYDVAGDVALIWVPAAVPANRGGGGDAGLVSI